MTQAFLELQVWLKIVLGLVLAAIVFVAALWIYAVIDFIRFVLKIRRH